MFAPLHPPGDPAQGVNMAEPPEESRLVLYTGASMQQQASSSDPATDLFNYLKSVLEDGATPHATASEYYLVPTVDAMSRYGMVISHTRLSDTHALGSHVPSRVHRPAAHAVQSSHPSPFAQSLDLNGIPLVLSCSVFMLFATSCAEKGVGKTTIVWICLFVTWLHFASHLCTLTSTEERTFGCRQPDHIWDFRCDDFFQVVDAAGFLCTGGPWIHDKEFALAVAGREAHIDKPIQKVCTKPFSS
eukprot:TRINITY_DN32645_c0_g2_i1.p1 TRINITY_DN32645_c0_g2~~TRINITY_DN32645_c0_g2_i1.p1  ORF type:complete len:245 (+),score=32.02 TRINITY_DN32645_c0_g2_i1:56-790(+)